MKKYVVGGEGHKLRTIHGRNRRRLDDLGGLNDFGNFMRLYKLWRRALKGTELKVKERLKMGNKRSQRPRLNALKEGRQSKILILWERGGTSTGRLVLC